MADRGDVFSGACLRHKVPNNKAATKVATQQ